ncbi:ABC transporter permease [Mycolicibacterium tusciae]|uniref:ABC transporter permease n=1 Tax=Mycolicibacterium tusciae TaxID=75922 RepID=UPI00024A29BC|nr:ABC transporter permease [Mycolicibacterium tusciae]
MTAVQEISAAAEAAPARRRRTWLPFGYLSAPMAVLVLLVFVPTIILFLISLGMKVGRGQSVWSLDAYVAILTDPLYHKVALTTVFIATCAMVVQLVIGVPLAYVMAFKSGRFEIPLLLGIVLLDQLNPVVRVYAWRMLLGRNGIINGFLQAIGVIDQPIDWLLFNQVTVIIVLSTSWITYTVIPLYAAMKAIDTTLFQAAADLGAGWWVMTRRILLPLAAPGIFMAVLLVYIPLFTDFATPTLVGGTSGYMLGQAVNDLILEQGDLARGAALSNLLLLAAGVVAAIAFRLAKINRLET